MKNILITILIALWKVAKFTLKLTTIIWVLALLINWLGLPAIFMISVSGLAIVGIVKMIRG